MSSGRIIHIQELLAGGKAQAVGLVEVVGLPVQGSIRGDAKVRTASTIKLPIMATIFREVADGRAKWDEQLELRKEDKVSGSGVARELSDGLRLPLRDLRMPATVPMVRLVPRDEAASINVRVKASGSICAVVSRLPIRLRSEMSGASQPATPWVRARLRRSLKVTAKVSTRRYPYPSPRS